MATDGGRSTPSSVERSSFLRLVDPLFQPVDGASFSFFRITLGALLVVLVARYFAHGWIDEFYVRPTFFFSYEGFEWIRVLPAPGMYGLFAVLAACAVAIVLGFRTRVAVGVFCLGLTWIHLIDKTNYLNHYYLISLLTGLLAILPSSRAWTLDARRSGDSDLATVPFWVICLLRVQVGLVYFFAGLAKLDSDWLIEAQPLRIWLAASGDLPLVGRWLEDTAVAYAFSWAGAAFDLSIPFLLAWQRTRAVAYAAVVAFHLATGWLFPIGLFPLVMIVVATIFFAPDWPRRFMASGPSRVADHAVGGAGGSPRRWLTVAFVAIWCAVQIAVPLRFVGRPGCVNWTEDGFRFAWRVMLIEKFADVSFRVVDRRSGREHHVRPRERLTPQQARMMSTQPDMLLQFAHALAKEAAAQGREVGVYADTRVTFNGRPSRAYVDPDLDLSMVSRNADHASWLSSPCGNDLRASETRVIVSDGRSDSQLGVQGAI